MNQTEGHKRLFATVLSLAIGDIRRYASTHDLPELIPELVSTRDASTAVAWVASNDTRPGGFLWVCDVLELNPEFVRSKALECKPRTPRGPKPKEKD